MLLKVGVVLTLSLIGSTFGKTINYSKSAGCSISVRLDLGEPQPLIVWPGTTTFVTPGNVTNGIIRLAAQQEIELICTSGFKSPLHGNSIRATCLLDNRFSYNHVEYLFAEFACKSSPYHTARKTGRQCGGPYNSNAFIVEVGFDVDKRFLQLFDSCHDEVAANNLWTHYYQRPDNNMFQSGYPRIGFIQGKFFPGLSVNNLYTIAQQRRTIAAIVQSEDLAWEYVKESGNTFMSRGHMTAKADFIFGPHQQATFWFINSAPQWQSFNGGNWQVVEDGVRHYIAQRGIHAEIWTGTYGVMSLPDVYGNHQKIYLSVDENNNGQIPVPKLYYKIVIDVANAAGIVFIGVNNPHATYDEIFRDYIICDDVSDAVNYISWRKEDNDRGFSYACDVNQFAKRVNDLPSLPYVNRLLI